MTLVDPSHQVTLSAAEAGAMVAAVLGEPTGTAEFTEPQARYLLDLLQAAARRGVHPDLDRVHEDCRRLLNAAEMKAATPLV